MITNKELGGVAVILGLGLILGLFIAPGFRDSSENQDLATPTIPTPVTPQYEEPKVTDSVDEYGEPYPDLGDIVLYDSPETYLKLTGKLIVVLKSDEKSVTGINYKEEVLVVERNRIGHILQPHDHEDSVHYKGWARAFVPQRASNKLRELEQQE